MKTTFLIALVAAQTAAFAAEFHIAPNGSDANPGTAEKPFATLEKARDAARGVKSHKAEGRSENIVILAAGTYRLTKTFEINGKDSGTVFRAAPVANVSICGSVAIPNSAVKPVTNKAMLARFVPELRGKILEIDLHALDIKDFGDIGPRGFRRPYIPAPLELVVDGEPLRIAQWPNAGTPGELIGKVLDKGSVTRNGEKPICGGTFTFKTDRPARWAHATDIWITGLFENGYADNTVKVKAFDLKKKTLSTVQPHMYGFTSGKTWNRWTALNLLEEIDLPGEFCADKASGKLYFLPPVGKDIAACALEVTMLKAPLVAIEGATGVVFDGITFENSRGMGVYIERGANNRIQNCVLRNLGMVAACIGKGVAADPDYRHGFTGQPISRELGSWHEHIYDNPCFNREAGTGHGIVNCQIYNLGAGAISLGGGDRKTLTPAGNFVENCDIHHFNRWDRTYKGAVNIDGVGNRISHCDIHDGPALALYLHGNDHLIEYNDIHRVVMEGNDMGALYMGRDPTERGNIIRYNYFHGLAPGHMTFCLYFDDHAGDGTTVYGNIFRKAGNAATVFVNASREMIIANNLFVDCTTQAVIVNKLGRWDPWKIDLFKQRMAAVASQQEPWRSRYPALLTYDFSANGMGKNIVSEKNLFVNCLRKPGQKFSADKLINRNNRSLTTAESSLLLINPAKGDFTLKPGANIGIPGFEPIPFPQIGVRKRN